LTSKKIKFKNGKTIIDSENYRIKNSKLFIDPEKYFAGRSNQINKFNGETDNEEIEDELNGIDGDSSNIYMTHQTFYSNNMQESEDEPVAAGAQQNEEVSKTSKSVTNKHSLRIDINKAMKLAETSHYSNSQRIKNSSNKSTIKDNVNKILNQLKIVKLKGSGGVGLRSSSLTKDQMFDRDDKCYTNRRIKGISSHIRSLS